MKKIIPSLMVIGLLAFPVIGLAQAESYDLPGEGGTAETAPSPGVMTTLNSLTNWLFAILLIIAAIFIIIAAYYFITAAGDPEKTKKARDFVIYSLIGVLVAFLAKGLVILVAKITGVTITTF